MRGLYLGWIGLGFSLWARLGDPPDGWSWEYPSLVLGTILRDWSVRVRPRPNMRCDIPQARWTKMNASVRTHHPCVEADTYTEQHPATLQFPSIFALAANVLAPHSLL